MSSITLDIYSFIPVLKSHVLPSAIDGFRLGKIYKMINVVLETE